MAKKTKRTTTTTKKGGSSDSSSSLAKQQHKKDAKKPPPSRKKNRKSQWGTAEDVQFRKSLEADGRYTIQEMASDGNCLFRSLSDQLFQDKGGQHGEVRSAVCDYMEQHEVDFSGFLVYEKDDDASDFESYVATMRHDGEWGGNLELVAAAKLYRRNITVFSANLSALNIGHGETSDGPDLLLSYHDNDHYSSVRDATANTKLQDKEVSSPSRYENKVGRKLRSDKNPPTEDKNAAGGDSQQSTLPPKKNSLCPCDSGKKFRRCCWRETRSSRKSKASDDSTKDTDSLSDVTFEMNGKFRVLQI